MRDRLIATALLTPLLLAIFFSCSRLACEGADVPDDNDYAAAALFLDARGLSDDDALIILPPWSLRPLVALGARRASRSFGSDGPWWTLTNNRYARMFVVEEPDGSPWREGVPLAGASLTSMGALNVSEVKMTTARYDFKTSLLRATVRIDSDDGGVVCSDRRAGGFGCPGREPWQRVNVEWALVSENGREIIWAHPPPAGQRLSLRYEDVPLGDILVVAAGHTRTGAEHAKAPVRLQVKIDDEVVATLLRQPSFVVEASRAGLRSAFVAPLDPAGQGFRADTIDTARFGTSRHTLTFIIDTDDDKSQEFAFDAFVPGGQ